MNKTSLFKKGNKLATKGKGNIKHGGRSLKNVSKMWGNWKPKTIIGEKLCISKEEEIFAIDFCRRMKENGDIYADKVMIELCLAQILQVHRQLVWASTKKIGKDVSRQVGTILSTMREMNATKNSRKENKININIESDFMTLVQNFIKDEKTNNEIQQIPPADNK